MTPERIAELRSYVFVMSGCADARRGLPTDCEILSECLDEIERLQGGDDTPITREWLLSIGGKNVESPMGSNYSDHVEFPDGFQLWDFNGDHWLIDVYDTYPLRTRGQVLLVMKGLGIK